MQDSTIQIKALYLAWLIALIATLSVLFIGEVMGQEPCLLCWYQRIAMFPLALILGIACFKEDVAVWRYGLPLAVIGGAIAIWHSGLILGFIPKDIEPCGAGPSCSSADMFIFGGVPIPVLSIVAFGAIVILLLFVRKGSRHELT